MMKKTLFFGICLIFSFQAQSQGLAWAKQISGIYEELPESMKIDSKGNIYISGTFSGTVDLDPGPGVASHTSNGIEDIFIVKFDSTGNYIWGHHIGGIDYDKCHSLIIDKHDNLYFSGEFNYTVDFDPGSGVFNLVETGYEDIYICKLTSDGDFVWAKQISGTDAVGYAFSMDIDHSGNLVLTGGFWATVDFDPGAGSYNLTSLPADIDIFVSKYDSLGNFIWARAMNGTALELARSIKADSADNIFISGRFEGTTDFDPGPGTFSVTPSGASDAYICKLSATGNFAWCNIIGSTAEELEGVVYLDTNANVFYNGRFGNTINIEIDSLTYTYTSAGAEDIILLKLDSAGNYLWAKQIGGPYVDEGHHIFVAPDGTSYYDSRFAGTVDVDPGTGVFELTCLTAPVSGNGFILKLDAEGNFVWAQQLQDPGGGAAYCFANLSNNRLLITGTFDDTLDIMPGPDSEELYATTTAGGWGDIFLTVWNTNTCAYMNPATTTSGNEITAVLSNATYQWLDCSTGSPLPGDTAQMYTATSNGTYAVIVSDNVCRDTSTCVTIMTTATNQLNDYSSYHVFPNPTTGLVNVYSKSFDPNSSFNVRLINLEGQTVIETKNISASGYTLDLGKNPQGIYFLEIVKDQSFERFKLVKN